MLGADEGAGWSRKVGVRVGVDCGVGCGVHPPSSLASWGVRMGMYEGSGDCIVCLFVLYHFVQPALLISFVCCCSSLLLQGYLTRKIAD